MAQTYTGSINLIMQATDNVSNIVMFSRQVVSVNPNCPNTIELQTIGNATGLVLLSGNLIPCIGFYVKNQLSSAGTLSVSWNNGTATVIPIVLPIGGIVMFFTPNNNAAITSITITPTSSADVEYILWR